MPYCRHAPRHLQLIPFQAGRLMVQEIAACVRRGESFAFETTLSGLRYARLIPQWRKKGYFVKLIFLKLPNPDMAIARVAARVVQGGPGRTRNNERRQFEEDPWQGGEISKRDISLL